MLHQTSWIRGRIAWIDVGTGYSSPQNLQQLSFERSRSIDASRSTRTATAGINPGHRKRSVPSLASRRPPRDRDWRISWTGAPRGCTEVQGDRIAGRDRRELPYDHLRGSPRLCARREVSETVGIAGSIVRGRFASPPSRPCPRA